eukprot:COSAG04_NODE_23291_length_341_cov_0.512397_1_plen_99_part_10
MLEAFCGSDNPPAVATRTWYVPAARSDGRRLHGCKVLSALSLAPASLSSALDVGSLSLSYRVSLLVRHLAQRPHLRPRPKPRPPPHLSSWRGRVRSELY